MGVSREGFGKVSQDLLIFSVNTFDSFGVDLDEVGNVAVAPLTRVGSHSVGVIIISSRERNLALFEN